ncbi:CBO0543 family protein [Tumebacillus permanentifrigoris]|uniref:CBO0543 family protein n=1 Tax=Tumebacillus permanentifrigoris TaxID=378543 RepID=UPI0011B24315|nr:CBO0543 family protein [Tumebacillus permanentifrigoris]
MDYRWVSWVAVAISILVIVFAPKRVPGHENFFILSFTSSFAFMFDLVVGNILDLYDYGTHRVEVLDLAQISIVNPAIGILLLNYWPERKGWWRVIGYLMLVVALLLCFELLWLKLDLMRYKGWSLLKSAISYPFLLTTLRIAQLTYRHMVRTASAAK